MATPKEPLTQGEEIATRIREVRAITGKTQVDFARIIGVSRSYLSEVEARKAKPSVEMIVGVLTNFPEIASPYWFLLGHGVPGPYDATFKFPETDWQAIFWALTLIKRHELSDKVTADKTVMAKILAALINAYARIFHIALDRGESEEHARLEAKARSAEVAHTLMSDLDTMISEGPAIPL